MLPNFFNMVMAKVFLLISISHLLTSTNSQTFSKTLSPKSLGLKKEKLSHLHFFFHDTISGANTSAVRVAEAPLTNTSHTGFVAIVMMDDPLTVGPEITSRVVGRAQGIYGFADLEEIGLLMCLNYVFLEGKYNGSTLSILGRNSVMDTVREMPIVGGSGLFRFARGYARAKTHYVDDKAGSRLGAMLSAFYGLNTGMPYVQKHVNGPKWLPFVVGIPPFLMFTAGSAAFGGYGLPKFTQLTVRSYYTASSPSHYGVSLLTRYIEDTHISRAHRERLG